MYNEVTDKCTYMCWFVSITGKFHVLLPNADIIRLIVSIMQTCLARIAPAKYSSQQDTELPTFASCNQGDFVQSQGDI